MTGLYGTGTSEAVKERVVDLRVRVENGYGSLTPKFNQKINHVPTRELSNHTSRKTEAMKDLILVLFQPLPRTPTLYNNSNGFSGEKEKHTQKKKKNLIYYLEIDLEFFEESDSHRNKIFQEKWYYYLHKEAISG